MRAVPGALLVAWLAAACAREAGRRPMPAPAGEPVSPPGPAPTAIETRVPVDAGSDGTPSVHADAVPAEDATAAVDAGAPQSPEDPWIGMTEADVRRVVARTHPTLRLSGDAKLDARGRSWTLEYEPGSCSYWTTRIELVFEHRRVVRATRARGRSTGKICDW